MILPGVSTIWMLSVTYSKRGLVLLSNLNVCDECVYVRMTVRARVWLGHAGTLAQTSYLTKFQGQIQASFCSFQLILSFFINQCCCCFFF